MYDDQQQFDPDDILPHNDELCFSYTDAQRVIRDYACPHCYSDLIMKDGGKFDGFLVECPECKKNVWDIGRIRKTTIALRYEKEHYEGIEIKKIHADLFPKEKKSEKQILSELGF